MSEVKTHFNSKTTLRKNRDSQLFGVGSTCYPFQRSSEVGPRRLVFKKVATSTSHIFTIASAKALQSIEGQNHYQAGQHGPHFLVMMPHLCWWNEFRPVSCFVSPNLLGWQVGKEKTRQRQGIAEKHQNKTWDLQGGRLSSSHLKTMSQLSNNLPQKSQEGMEKNTVIKATTVVSKWSSVC